MYQAPIAEGPSLPTLIGAGVVFGWLYWSDPAVADLFAEREPVEWAALAALLLAAVVIVAAVSNITRTLGQLLQGVAGIGVVAVIVVALVVWSGSAAPVVTAPVAPAPQPEVAAASEEEFTGFDTPPAEEADAEGVWWEEY